MNAERNVWLKVVGCGVAVAAGLGAAMNPLAAIGATIIMLALGVVILFHERLARRSTTILFVATAFIVAAFIPITVPSDALTGGVDVNRAREIIMLLVGVTIVGGYALSRGELQLDWRSPTCLIATLFTLWALLSAAWSLSYALTIAKSIEFYLLFIGAALVASVVARTVPASEKFAKVLALALVAVVGLGLIVNLILWGTPIYFIEVEEYTRRLRFAIGYAPPLAVADLLALTVICLFASDLSKWLKVPLGVGCLVLLALTAARGASAAVVVALAAMSLFHIKYRVIRIAIGMGLVLLVGAIFTTAFNLIGVATTLWGEDALSLNGRTDLWSFSIPLVMAKPITGYGYYASRFVLLDEFYWAGHTHNSYLEITLATGFVGLLLLVLFTLYACYTAIKTGDKLLIGLGIFCFISGMLNPLLFIPGIPMFILLASLMTAGRYREQQVREYVPVADARLRGMFADGLAMRYGPR